MANFIWNQTDETVKEIYSLMVRDFSRFEKSPFLDRSVEALKSSPMEFRDLEWPVLGIVPPYRFKVMWQCQNFLKRHRFSSDAYTDEQLKDITRDKFLANQLRLSATHLPSSCSTRLVLREARRLAREILGSTPDFSRIAEDGRFGKRATIGNLREDAYLDRKLGDPDAFTCPPSLRRWFFREMRKDPHLYLLVRRLWKKTGGDLPLGIDYLNLVNVPKSWKIERPITPLTNIGLFFTNGLRYQVEESLDAAGLPIRRLQHRHRMLARKASISRKNATVDLASASDSILSWLLNAVLPRAWYNVIKLSFIRQLRVDDKEVHTMSVLPMGNTITFPIETLIFYCLIKAIGNLLNVKGIYSVYGDDLIYPVKIHRYVVETFSRLGLLVGAEKTFASMSPFRESCGADFYHGVDVRPAFAPEVNAASFTGVEYSAWLYKLYNNLARRWTWNDLPKTFGFILGELAYSSGQIFVVPPSYPDFAGIKGEVPLDFEWLPIAKPKWVYSKCDGCHMIQFRSIAIDVPNRAVLVEDAFYWEWLSNRARSDRSDSRKEGFGIQSFLDHTDRFSHFLLGMKRGNLSYRHLKAVYGEPIDVEPSLFLKYKWKVTSEKAKVGRRRITRYEPETLDPRKKGSPVQSFCKSKACFLLRNQVGLVHNWA